MNEEYIERVIQKVVNHEWVCSTLIVPLFETQATKVRIANKLRSLGYHVELDGLNGFIDKMTIKKNPPNESHIQRTR